jgi:hypothetical protein
VWRSYELIERTDFLRSFTAFLPNSRFALSRLCPEASTDDSRRSLNVCDPDNVEGSHRSQATTRSRAHTFGSTQVPSSTVFHVQPHTLLPPPLHAFRAISFDWQLATWVVPTTSRRRTSSMENAYTRTPAEALQHFQVREEQGLSDQQVASLREKHGKNGMLAALQPASSCVVLRTDRAFSIARGAPDTHLGAYS